MFNLLMSGSGWEPNRDSLTKGRVLEYTAKHIEQIFMPSGVLDLEAITNIPSLFCSETSFDGDQSPARVGRLMRVRLVGTEYHFDYLLDPDIPPIPNSALESLSRSLGIADFEFTRTHWSIKESDLFEVLFKAGLGIRHKSRVFDASHEICDAKLAAVMMPFDAKFSAVYVALQAAACSVGMTCQRVDDIWVHDHIIQDVVSLICKANIVICDLTGRNPNVFYEMGIAHTLGKDVIMITQNAQDVPFDVAHIRHIRYLPNGEGMENLTIDVSRRLEGLLESRR